MVTGVGVDAVDIERIRRSLDRYGDRFLEHVFTPAERDDCIRLADPVPRLAAYLATKEAAFKALNPPKTTRWRDLEVRCRDDGSPVVQYHGRARETARATETLVSMSWTGGVALSVVIVVAAPEKG